MKIYIFSLIVIIFSVQLYGQEKCYCDLVENYTKQAKKYFPNKGEYLETVPYGTELWIDMRPVSHQRNQQENGGCRLIAGEKYVSNRDGEPIRAWKCGNPIKKNGYVFYSINNQSPSAGGHTTETNQSTNSSGVIIINDDESDSDFGSGKKIGFPKKKPLIKSLSHDVGVANDYYRDQNIAEPSYTRWYPKIPALFGAKWKMSPVGSVLTDVAIATLLFYGTDLAIDGQFNSNWRDNRGSVGTTTKGGPGYSPSSIKLNF